jgi:hypothetical protein
MKCRSKTCAVGTTKSFKVGDLRVAVDEVTGRLGVNQVNDDDPYFATCFFHLQCFEGLTCIPELVVRKLLVSDDRTFHHKEPECTRINKMRLSLEADQAFAKWRLIATTGLGNDKHWKPPNNRTLACVLWLSSIRKGRKHFRAPPGVTSDDIEKVSSPTERGGVRAFAFGEDKVTSMEAQGRVAPSGETREKRARPNQQEGPPAKRLKVYY